MRAPNKLYIVVSSKAVNGDWRVVIYEPSLSNGAQ